MTGKGDGLALLLDQVRTAITDNTPLRIHGGDSKAALGHAIQGRELDTRCHSGIVHYDPTELVITARAGTPLLEIEAALDAAGQMLPCEPPHLGEGATLGGMVAAGVSGPRRPWAGSVRDYVLGTRVINGYGQHVRFGGEVMKNVAGYDLSRLLAGSFGCLGVLTEVSLKVLPKPRCQASLCLEIPIHHALDRLAEWGQQPLPITAAAHDGQVLRLRLEGGEGSVRAAFERLGGDNIDAIYWHQLRELRLPFFDAPTPLWRLSLPHHTPPMDLPGMQLIDWGGAQRWLKSDADPRLIRDAAARHGGHATAYDQTEAAFHPLPPALMHYHRNLKHQLDPHRIFNPGRMYLEI